MKKNAYYKIIYTISVFHETQVYYLDNMHIVFMNILLLGSIISRRKPLH